VKSLILILALLQSAQDIYKAANADFDAGRWGDAARLPTAATERVSVFRRLSAFSVPRVSRATIPPVAGPALASYHRE